MIISESLSENELRAIASDVVRLSALLTRERERLSTDYMKDSRLRKAYLAYFVPANLPKIHLPLKELALHPMQLFSRDRLMILDLGSGPGTAVLGILEFFSRLGQSPFLDFTAIDNTPENLDDAEALFQSWRDRTGLKSSLRTLKTTVEESHRRLSGERFDIVVLSNVLNELFYGHKDRIRKRRHIIQLVMDGLLDEHGSCIIIEPALRETSREMLEAVCGLVNDGINIYSPCHAAGLCGTLSNPKDWQHEEVPWDAPEIIRKIDRIAGLIKDALKFSYVVLRRDGLSIMDVFGMEAYRVVSEPLVTRGKMEFYLCGREGRRLITRLDKDRTDSNIGFDALRRGDFVLIEGAIDEGKRLKVTKETRVTVKRV